MAKSSAKIGGGESKMAKQSIIGERKLSEEIKRGIESGGGKRGGMAAK